MCDFAVPQFHCLAFCVLVAWSFLDQWWKKEGCFKCSVCSCPKYATNAIGSSLVPRRSKGLSYQSHETQTLGSFAVLFFMLIP